MARIGSRGAMRSWAIVGMIVVALHLTGATSARAELTSNQLLDGLPKVSGPGAVGFALEMQSLGMTWANADLIARHQAPIFCLPPQPALTQQKLIEIFRRTIQDVPTLGERPFGMALLIAFKRTYPCQP